MISLAFLIATAPVDATPLSRQEQILQRIMQQQATTARSFGACSYSWDEWKLAKDGVRTSSRLCKEAKAEVAVACNALQINVKPADAKEWTGWRSPIAKGAEPGEALMVAALCANVAN